MAKMQSSLIIKKKKSLVPLILRLIPVSVRFIALAKEVQVGVDKVTKSKAIRRSRCRTASRTMLMRKPYTA